MSAEQRDNSGSNRNGGGGRGSGGGRSVGGGRSSGRGGGGGRGGEARRGGSRPPARSGGSGDRRYGLGPRPEQGPRPEPGPRPESGPRPAPRAPFRGPEAPRHDDGMATPLGVLSLAAWDLARTRRKLPDTSRGYLMTLRTHQRLVAAFEASRAIPDNDRSFLRVQDTAKGSFLLVHGVSSRPGDLRPLALFLHEAGYNVYVLRLPDYGTPGHTISEVSWESALEEARQCFGLLNRGGGSVHVVGMGFGATLALHLAAEERVASLVLLAPAIMARESFLQRMLVRLKLHRMRAIHRWIGWNADLMEGMDLARGKIGRIQAPMYAAQCEDDDRASPNSLRFLQRKARHEASRFQIFPEGGHAILAAHGEALLYREILNFCSER